MTEPKKRSLWPKLFGCGCLLVVVLGAGVGVLACAGVSLGGGAAAGLTALVMSSDADIEPPDKSLELRDPTLDIEPDAVNAAPDALVEPTLSEPTVTSSAALSAPSEPTPSAETTTASGTTSASVSTPPPTDDEQNLDDEPSGATKGGTGVRVTSGGISVDTRQAAGALKGALGGGKTAHVDLEGGGRVVLVGGGKRYPLPADVPTGRYDIEATFPPDPPVNVGKITVNASGATVSCNEAMGMCRGS